MSRSPAVTRLALLATTALAAAGLTATLSSGAVNRVKVKCPQKSVSFLYWPKGHDERPQAGFPEFRTPHLEIYGGLHTTTFPPQTIGYIDASGAAQTSSECTNKGSTSLSGKDIPHATKRTGKAANVQCKFGEKTQLVFSQVSSGARVDAVLATGTRVVQVRIKQTGSSIVFNERRCDAKPPPG